MKKMKGKGLKHILTMAFTFAMVMVFAGLIGKVDAKAAETCTMTIKVTDTKEKAIENAVPFVDIWEPEGYSSYKINRTIEATPEDKNDDGSYSITITWDNTVTNSYGDTVEGNWIATPGASAKNYKTKRSTAKQAYNAGYGDPGFQLKYGNDFGEYSNESPYTVKLEAQKDQERLVESQDTAKTALYAYKKETDYDAEDWAKITKIQEDYEALIYGVTLSDDLTIDAAEAKIEEYLAKAKEEMDAVVTTQSKANDKYADYISFVSADGKTTRVLAGSNGKYSITMSMQDKNGTFKVDNASGIEWSAKEYYGNFPLEYIAISGGGFLLDSKQGGGDYSHARFHSGTLSDCSVTFTPSGSEVPVTVVFDLIVKDKMIKDLTVNAPSEAIVLSRNDDLDYTTVLKYGSDYSVTVNYDNEDSKDLDTDDVTMESITPTIATVDENGKIKVSAAGVAEFRATVKDETGSYDKEFSIEFVKSQKEEKEIIDAADVTSKIEALGTITLEKETAVSEARDAYDDLSSNAKKRISKETLSTLKTAEKEIARLKAKKAEDDKAAAEKAAADKAVADKVAADKATADKAAADKATADKAAAEAVEKKIAALGTITLTKESAVKAARDAYDALDSSAKKLVKAASLTTLKAAEQKIYDLKVDKAAADKVAAEKAAAAKKAAADKKKYTPTAPKWKSLKSTKKGAATLTWAKNSKATGYEIYVSTKKTSGFKKLATVKSWKKVTYTKTKLKSKTTYYFKIRAYKTVNKTTYRSAYSTVKKVKTK